MTRDYVLDQGFAEADAAAEQFDEDVRLLTR
jgi:hypothetical protein